MIVLVRILDLQRKYACPSFVPKPATVCLFFSVSSLLESSGSVWHDPFSLGGPDLGAQVGLWTHAENALRLLALK